MSYFDSDFNKIIEYFETDLYKFKKITGNSTIFQIKNIQDLLYGIRNGNISKTIKLLEEEEKEFKEFILKFEEIKKKRIKILLFIIQK